MHNAVALNFVSNVSSLLNLRTRILRVSSHLKLSDVHHDNARFHSSLNTGQVITEYGWTGLPYHYYYYQSERERYRHIIIKFQNGLEIGLFLLFTYAFSFCNCPNLISRCTSVSKNLQTMLKLSRPQPNITFYLQPNIASYLQSKISNELFNMPINSQLHAWPIKWLSINDCQDRRDFQQYVVVSSYGRLVANQGYRDWSVLGFFIIQPVRSIGA